MGKDCSLSTDARSRGKTYFAEKKGSSFFMDVAPLMPGNTDCLNLNMANGPPGVER